LLLAGEFPALGEVVSRLSWALSFEAHFIYVGVLAVSLALQRMLGALMNWRVLECQNP
jgi:hypothetical protein